MNKKIVKITSTLLLGTMIAYTTPIFAFSKEENVYSKMNANGDVYKTIVSTHLVNGDKEEILKDLTDLINIENVSGDETFSQDGDNLIWNANGADIYYQGETEKQLPIKCKISYELDGKEILAEDLVGKAGKVKIKIEYENLDSHMIYVNGRKTTMYTPFAVACGTVFSNTENSNIEITNGKVINDGTKTMVLGIALPGMQESLNISSKDIEIPSSIEITMETTKYEQNNIITFITPKITENSFSFDKLNTLYSKINEIQQASKSIEDGANALKEGTEGFSQKSQEFNGAMKQLEEGVTKANSSYSEINNGINTLDSKSTELKSGANKLNAGVDKVSSGLNELSTGVVEGKAQATSALEESAKTLSAGIDKIIAGKNTETETIKKQVIEAPNAQLKKGLTTTTKDANGNVSLSVGDGAKQLAAGTLEAILKDSTFTTSTGINLTDAQKTALVQTLSAKMDTSKLNAGIESAIDGMTKKQETGLDLINNAGLDANGNIKAGSTEKDLGVKAGLTSLKSQAGTSINDGIKQISDGFDSITNGVTELSNGTKTLKAGTTELYKGTVALKTGTAQLNTGSNQMKDGLNTLETSTKMLSSANDQLTQASVTIKEGAFELATGVEQFNTEAINKICNYINSDVKDIAARAEKLQELAENYEGIAKSNEDENKETKFIIVTDSLKVKDEEAKENN